MKNVLAFNRVNEVLKRYSDGALAFLVILIVSLFIVPVPTAALDLLITFNISLSLILLLISLYITNPLSLSSFPSILLVTTLFRLGINVATARRILLDADAGEVIHAFGDFVVQGNVIVGLVIFLLLMLINMLVVAKGSERVAEVAARFTLDAMPGKQMSIDADVRAGTLEMEEAQIRRANLARESQLFGAMDGAMKFVKGDVIAGIIIFALNIIAGIIIGISQKEMSLDEALETFTILSIGDGLVSIIPSLLMSVCAGFIVTRVSSGIDDSNIGKDVASQVTSQPKAFALAAAFIILIGQIPGLPRMPFTIIGLFVGACAFLMFHVAKNNQNNRSFMENLLEHREQKLEQDKEKAKTRAKAQEGESANLMPMVTPVTLEVGHQLVSLVDDSSNFISELIPMMRDGIFYELGIRLPGIKIRATEMPIAPNAYVIMLNETPVARGTIDPDLLFVNAQPETLAMLGIEAIQGVNPFNGAICSFAPKNTLNLLESSGYHTFDAKGYMILHVSAVVRKNAADFLGLQEVQNMLEQLEQAFPALVKEVVPKVVALQTLVDVLKRLVDEEISIRDLRNILQCLAEWSGEKDTSLLTERVRSTLKRYITYKYAGDSRSISVYILDPKIEDALQQGVQFSPMGNYVALEPEVIEDILQAMRNQFRELPSTAPRPVILANQDIRRYFRRLIQHEFHHIAVLSYSELMPNTNIHPVGRIRLR